MSTVVSNDVRRYTIVSLKQVNELPLRNVLQTFDKNGDGKIDISELQKIVYWYGLWKHASIGLCLLVMTLVWATFGLTIWAIELTKDYTVTDGVLTGGDEVVKMSVASTYIPLSWATLLDRRHLDSLESLTIDVTQSTGKFSAGVYHMKVASYLHSNSSYLKLFGEDGSRVWVNSGTVVLHHPDAEEAIMVCGAAACNTLAVDVKPEYLQQLVQRGAALFQSKRDFELPAEVDGVFINKAEGEGVTCMANTEFAQGVTFFGKYATTSIYRQFRNEKNGKGVEVDRNGKGEPTEKINYFVKIGKDEFDDRFKLANDVSLGMNERKRAELEFQMIAEEKKAAAAAPKPVTSFMAFGGPLSAMKEWTDDTLDVRLGMGAKVGTAEELKGYVSDKKRALKEQNLKLHF